MTYPCDWCDSCSIWLAAYEIEELDSIEKIVEFCEARKCSIVGKEVSTYELD